MLNPKVLRLYAVTDRRNSNGNDLPLSVERAILGGVTFVQLREKNISNDEYIYLAKEVKKVTDCYNVPLVINDNVDVVLASGASGVHLGQNDMGVMQARKILGPNKIIGCTAKTIEQSVNAFNNGADYIGTGAAFPSNTKTDAITLTHQQIKYICDNSPLPSVVIGGISVDNAQYLKGIGANGIAVSSALFSSEDIISVAEKLYKIALSV